MNGYNNSSNRRVMRSTTCDMHVTPSPSMRPMLMQTLRMAINSGDAVMAANLYRTLAGEQAAAKVGPRDVLGKVGGWLDEQSSYKYDFLSQ